MFCRNHHENRHLFWLAGKVQCCNKNYFWEGTCQCRYEQSYNLRDGYLPKLLEAVEWGLKNAAASLLPLPELARTRFEAREIATGSARSTVAPAAARCDDPPADIRAGRLARNEE